MTGLQPIQSTIDKIILGRPDAMTMTKGIAERCMYQHAGKVSILMKVSNYSPVAPTMDTIFGTVDEAIRMGADGVSMGAMTLGDFQGEQFEAIGRFSEECARKGMPLIGHVYPKGESVPKDQRTSWENIAYCVRSACELGMDIVKTTYTVWKPCRHADTYSALRFLLS
jgi:class I fructose-bisphosphate aldolase